jgi:hypothetical protein
MASGRRVTEAFLDTTVFVEITLREHQRRQAALERLARYTATILPTYAIKEFRAGPLDTYVWFHNLLLQERSLAAAVARSAAEAAFRPNRLRTAVELHAHLLKEKFPQGESPGQSARRMRLYLRKLVYKSWDMRETVAARRTARLGCFPEECPMANLDGQIVLRPNGCVRRANCSLVDELRSAPEQIGLLLAVVESGPDKRENRSRAKALRYLQNFQDSQRFGDRSCRGLGDAVFALTAPANACILTTNLKDHAPLAEALGKRAERL